MGARARRRYCYVKGAGVRVDGVAIELPKTNNGEKFRAKRMLRYSCRIRILTQLKIRAISRTAQKRTHLYSEGEGVVL
jgi:hypothetical protein